MNIESGATISIDSAHQPDGERVHGHTWFITAWFECADMLAPVDGLKLREALRTVCAPLDHTLLPAHLVRAEQMAAHILQRMPPECCRIEISRPGCGLHARASR